METSRLWRVFSHNIVVEPMGDNEFAVFNGAYWDSSLLNSIDECLLRSLMHSTSAPIAEEELASGVARELELPVDESLVRYVGLSLNQMAYVGLICRERPVENQ